MTQNEVAAIVKGISLAVYAQVNLTLREFGDRMTAMEQRIASVRDGTDGDVGATGPQGERGEVGLTGPVGPVGNDGAPGRDADETRVLALEADVQALREELMVRKEMDSLGPAIPHDFYTFVEVQVESAVAKSVAQIQPVHGKDGADGASVTVEELRPVVAAEVRKAVEALPPAQDGAPGPPAVIDMTVIDVMVSEHVKTTLSVWPQPKDGSSVTVEDVRPLIAGEIEKQVAAIPPAQNGKDGVGVFGGVIDRDNHLVLTLSDGTVKDFGIVVGRDGRDADMDAIKQHIVAELEKWEKPKDGEPGAPGRDGRDGTLKNLKFVQSDDLRTVTACFKDGTPIEGGRFTFPVVIDRGVFKAGTAYQAGDGTTFGGSFWIAQRDTSEKPGDGPTGWRLAVKRGGDGKDGKVGMNGKDGAPGPPGRDGNKTW